MNKAVNDEILTKEIMDLNNYLNSKNYSSLDKLCILNIYLDIIRYKINSDLKI